MDGGRGCGGVLGLVGTSFSEFFELCENGGS